MKRICALLCCILVLTLFVPARAQEGWGFTGASFFEALELGNVYNSISNFIVVR